jgi:hypothetical protein
LRDLLHIYRSIYSPAYERPESRRP